MKDIKVLGPGCPKCGDLADLVQNTATELGIEFKIEKINDINKIMEYNVMFTPALIVNGEIKVAGKVPSVDELKEMLQ